MENFDLKNIIFDMGGVLIDLDRKSCIESFKNLGFEDVENYIGDFIQSDHFLKFEEGKISTNQFFDFIRFKTHDSVSDDLIRKAWCRFLLTIPNEKLDLILRLRKKYKVYLLSNTNPIHFEHIETFEFGKNGHFLSDYFTACFLSYRLHLSKPDKAIFEYMIQSEGLIPSESLFIDDGNQNIETANELGFQTYLAKPFEDFNELFKPFI